MGYISYQVEKAAVKGSVGLLGYMLYALLIVVAVAAVAAVIGAVVAVMLLASLLSVSVALWRRHVLHQPGSFGELRPGWMKPTQWGDKTKRQSQVPATPPAQVVAALEPASSSPTAPSTPRRFVASPSFIPNRITQQWIEHTVPTLNDNELTVLIDVMHERAWTEDDLEKRVYPYITS